MVEIDGSDMSDPWTFAFESVADGSSFEEVGVRFFRGAWRARDLYVRSWTAAACQRAEHARGRNCIPLCPPGFAASLFLHSRRIWPEAHCLSSFFAVARWQGEMGTRDRVDAIRGCAISATPSRGALRVCRLPWRIGRSRESTRSRGALQVRRRAASLRFRDYR